MAYSIRNIKLYDFEKVYKRIENDFAPEEYAPYRVLYNQIKEGIQKAFVLLEEEQEVAYAICAGEGDSDYVLISFLAVYKEFRGTGVGTAFLEELKKMYSNKKGLIVEVEKPENALNNKARIICEKRIQFYQKANFYLIQDIEYEIWDVPMYLMVLPHKATKESVNEEIEQVIYEIYLDIMSKRFIHKMKLRRI